MPWISIPDAKRAHGGVIYDTEESTNALGIANSSARLIPAGAVCLSRTASVGYVAITSRPMATSQDFVNWICGDQLLPEFLQLLFLAEGEGLLRFASGAVHKTIYFPEVKAFHVCVPEVATQRRLVGILEECLAAIAIARANVESSLQRVRELFESVVQSVFSARNPTWKDRTLGEVCGIVSKLVDPRDPKYLDLPHIGAGNIEPGSGVLFDVRTAREEKLISGKFLFDEGSVLYSKIRPYLRKVVRPSFVGLCSADIYPLLPTREAIDRDYLFYMLLAPSFTEYAITGSARAGMPKVNRDHLFAYRTWLPPIQEQVATAAKLDALSGEVRRLTDIGQAKLAALDELKKSLFYQAFTGALTSKSAVKEVAEVA